MRKAFLTILFILSCTFSVFATDVTISSLTWTNLPFNPSGLGGDRAIAVTVTNGSATVTSSAAFPPQMVGIGGFKVLLGGTVYTVDSVASTSSLTLTANYGGSTGSTTMTLYKYVLLRVYATASFRPNGETYLVQPGTPGTGSFYKQVAASIISSGSNSVLYTPSFTLPATVDATINNQARYVLGWYRPDGSLISFFTCGSVQQIALPATTPTTFGAICDYNSPGGVIPPPNEAYTKTQIDARFPSCTSGQMLYYAATGNIQSCLTVGSGLSISGGTITATGGGGGGITIDSTPITGGTSTYLLYHGSGNVVRELGFGTTLAVSGGILKNQQIRNAINLIDYGADPSGVSNSTTAIQNWITACQASYTYVCYAPGGLYLTDPITQSLNGLRIVGDGREKTVFKARTANNPIINITGANYFVNTTIDGIGFLGQGKASGSSGHCVSISDATGGTAQFEIKNASFTNCGGKGLYIPYMFAGRFRNLIFDEIGDNHMEIQGGSATIIEGVDFKTLEASKVALWIYSGNPVVIGNNGIEPDSGASTVWGRFGRSTSEGDSTDSYVLGASFIGNNVEDFKGVGWQFRTGSGGATYSGNTFISPTSGTVTAIYYYFLSGTETGIWSGGTFTLQGTAAWTNSQPVHARGYAPFYVSGSNTPANFYEWNAAETRTLPYVRPKLLAGTTKNGLQVSELMADAIYDSSLAGILTGTTDPSGNASVIRLQAGSASRPVYSFSGDTDSGMYSSAGSILWATDGVLRMTLNNTYGLALGDNSTGTGKFTAQGSGAATGFYVRTASVPGTQGGLVMPFEGGGNSFGPGIWWSSGAYNAQSGFWLSNGLNWQSASSTHSQWKLRKSTGTSTDGDIVLNLHPDDGYIGFSPFGTSAGNTSEARFYELAAGGSNYVGFKAPDAITTNRIWTLPSADGSASQCLQTNGSGVLSFGACSGGGMSIGGTVTSGTAGSVLFVNSGPVLAQDNTNFYWDDTNNRLSLGGIGGAPAAPLHVLADSSNLGVRVKANAAAINVDLSSDGSVGFLGTTTNHGLELWTNSTTRVRIEAGGLVGINDATPGAQLDVTANGTGTVGAIVNGANGATADLLKLQINGTDIVRFVPVSGDVNTVLSDGALATTATDGFVYFPSMAGVPSGVPTGYTGTIPLVVDSTNSRLYGRIGGSWVNLSGGSSGITVGTTTITSGTNTRVLYNNAGVVGEYAVTGTGNAVLSASPTLTGRISAADGLFATTVSTGTGASAGLQVTANSLTTGNGAEFSSSSVSGGNVVFIAATGTAAASNTKTALNVSTSGANATSSQTTYGAQISNTSTGTGSTNIALNLSASGGTTNTALNIANGILNFAQGASANARVIDAGSGSNGWRVINNNGSGGGATNVLVFERGDSTQMLGINTLQLSTVAAIGLGTTASSSDLTLRRNAAANLALGAADAAAPVGQTLSVQNVVEGTSNTAGANWTFAFSRGTGNASGGAGIWQVAPAGSSGTAQNALVEAMRLSGEGNLRIGPSTASQTGSFTVLPNNAATNSIVDIARLGVNSTGTAASGFGGRLSFSAETSTTNDTLAAQADWAWSDATHASRTSYLAWSIVNSTTTTEMLRLDPNGLRIPEISSAATPATNNVYLYAKDKTGVSTLYYKKDDGTEVEIGSGGSGTPGGSNTQIQYNNAGSFGGISGLTTNGSTTLVQTSSNAAAFESGPNGSTNPVFRLVNNVVSAATGLSITGKAAGSGVTLTALSSGTNEDIVINPKGGGAIQIGTGPFARFDSAHNSNFTASTGVLKLGNDFWMSSNLAAVGLNTYYNGANFVYAQPDPAFLFGFNANRNAFKIQAAASGTGGSTVTFSAGLAVLSDATVGVNKESSTGAQFHAVSGSSSRVALRADSASSNTADIAQFTVNGSTTAGDYVGLASGGAVKVRRQTYSGSGTQTLNLANGSVHELTVTGTTTIALSNIQNGGFYIIAVIQDATGGRSVTLPSTIKLPGGSWIFTTTANARDEFHCYSDGTNLYCMPQADVK